MRIIPIHPMNKKESKSINGGLTSTSKMPCKSYSLPTEACITGFKMAQIPGSISAMYPDKRVTIPASLTGFANVTVSNVHTSTVSLIQNNLGKACNAPNQNGECQDCRLCWDTEPVSYAMH